MMIEQEWPYNLPIWRSSHKAVSPDGKYTAEIDPANERGMGNPSDGILKISNGQKFEECSPCFLWSSDSKFLVVPQFVTRYIIFGKQRILLINVEEKIVYASKDYSCYIQPKSFEDGLLVATHEPYEKPETLSWNITPDLNGWTRQNS